jgi:hydrogenase maturation protease
MSSSASQIAVVGVGNLLMCDEGVGVHALTGLRDSDLDARGVRWIDGGTDAWGALLEARGCRHLVVIDAIRAESEPGTIYCLSPDRLKNCGGQLSLHDVSLMQLLAFEEAMGHAFETARIVGMEPERIEQGLELSPRCRRALPRLRRCVWEIVCEVRDTMPTQGAQPCW